MNPDHCWGLLVSTLLLASPLRGQEAEPPKPPTKAFPLIPEPAESPKKPAPWQPDPNDPVVYDQPAPRPAEPLPDSWSEPLPPRDHEEPDLSRQGFYLHVAMGLGWFRSQSAADGGQKRSFNGASYALDVAIGGSPGRGVAVGFGYLRDRTLSLSSTDEREGTQDVEGIQMNHLLCGLYLDIFPDPDAGFHVQTLFGLGELSVVRDNGFEASTADGLGLMLGGGYQWSVSRHLHVGILGRLVHTLLTRSERFGEVEVSTLYPTLLATGTLH